MDNRQKVINAISRRSQAVEALAAARAAEQAALREVDEAEAELARQLKNCHGLEKRVLWNGNLYWAEHRSPISKLSVGIEPANFEMLQEPGGTGCHGANKLPTASGGKR